MEKMLLAASLLLALTGTSSGQPQQVPPAPDLQIAFRQSVDKLNEPNVATKISGIREIGKLGSMTSTASRMLAIALEDQDVGVRLEAARSLAALGPAGRAAVPELIRALDDPSIRVRIQAGDALASMAPHSSAAVPKLLDLLAEKDAVLRERIVLALGAFPEQAPQIVPHLIKILQSKQDLPPTLAQAATFTLGNLGAGSAPATAELLDCLNSTDKRLRSFAVRAMGRIGTRHKEVLPTRIKLLQNRKEPVLHIRAARAVGTIGPEAREAIPALLALLKAPGQADQTKAEVLRGNVIWALGEMGEHAAEAVPLLRGVLQNNVHSRLLRQKAIRALGKIGPKASPAIDDVMAIMKDRRTASLSSDAAPALERMGPKGIPALVLVLTDNTTPYSGRYEAAQSLVRLGPQAKCAIPQLQKLLLDLHGTNRNEKLAKKVENALTRIQETEKPASRSFSP